MRMGTERKEEMRERTGEEGEGEGSEGKKPVLPIKNRSKPLLAMSTFHQ